MDDAALLFVKKLITYPRPHMLQCMMAKVRPIQSYADILQNLGKPIFITSSILSLDSPTYVSCLPGPDLENLSGLWISEEEKRSLLLTER